MPTLYETMYEEFLELCDSIGLPTKVVYRGLYNKKTETYYKNSKEHRRGDKPSHIERNTVTGVITSEAYRKKGLEHRVDDKPALIKRATNGRVILEKYYDHGLLHRTGGKPAIVIYDGKTGAVTRERYFEHGTEYKPEAPSSPQPLSRSNRAILGAKELRFHS